jgi:pantoate kinase
MAGPRPDGAEAFAPAVISNFFGVFDEGMASSPPDLSRVGATGGGFTLSRGVFTRASVRPAPRPQIRVTVNGDPRYPARTTTKAVELLLASLRGGATDVELEQRVEVPIGCGFGTSSASALSAVMAVGSALGLRYGKAKLASFAHAADILCGTGLGTVSSTYDHTGAGVITRPGGPGVAEVRAVRAPRDVRVVVASFRPWKAKPLLSSPETRERLDSLGAEALRRATSPLTFDNLLGAGEFFSRNLGLETPPMRRLIERAKESGAIGAAQNMIGNSVHAVVWKDDLTRVHTSMRRSSPGAHLQTFLIGGEAARVIKGAAAP